MASSPLHEFRHGEGPRRSRMLVVVALAGAALLTGCGVGVQSDPGNPPGPPAIVGADPVPIAGDRLEASGLFDAVSEQTVVVRWVEPGESIAVLLGGSGGGGACIPQPHAAGLEPAAPSIVVRFDPADPEAMCTMDFTLHGWELGLAEPIDATRIVPVRLVNMSGAEEGIDLELGPDDLLDAGTADPQPSEIPEAADAPAPEPIPSEQLEQAGLLDQTQQLAVRWIEPGRTLALVVGGSSQPGCQPTPTGAVSTGPGTISIAFEPATATTCTDDLVPHGWRITLPSTVSATMPIAVSLDGPSLSGTPERLTLEPGDVLELP